MRESGRSSTRSAVSIRTALCNSECTKDCHDAAGTGKIRLRYSSGEILSHPQRCVVINQGRLTPKWPENMKVRSQDLGLSIMTVDSSIARMSENSKNRRSSG